MSKSLTQLVGNKKKPRKKYRRHGGGILSNEAELALTLGEEARTVRSWYHLGLIPAIVLGHRTVRFKLDDVLAALAKREVKAVTDRKAGTS